MAEQSKVLLQEKRLSSDLARLPQVGSQRLPPSQLADPFRRRKTPFVRPKSFYRLDTVVVALDIGRRGSRSATCVDSFAVDDELLGQTGVPRVVWRTSS